MVLSVFYGYFLPFSVSLLSVGFFLLSLCFFQHSSSSVFFSLSSFCHVVLLFCLFILFFRFGIFSAFILFSSGFLYPLFSTFYPFFIVLFSSSFFFLYSSVCFLFFFSFFFFRFLYSFFLPTTALRGVFQTTMRPLATNCFKAIAINVICYKLPYVEHLFIVTQYSGHYVLLCTRVQPGGSALRRVVPLTGESISSLYLLRHHTELSAAGATALQRQGAPRIRKCVDTINQFITHTTDPSLGVLMGRASLRCDGSLITVAFIICDRLSCPVLRSNCS